MNKLLRLLIACLLMGAGAMAQDKITIGIVSSDTRDNHYVSNAENGIMDAVSDAFVKTKRFIIVERGAIKAVKQEKELQKSEDFIDGKTVAQGASTGAQYLVMVGYSGYHNDGSVCRFLMDLKVVDVASGETVNSETINAKGGGHGKQIAGAIGSVAVSRYTHTYGYSAGSNEPANDDKAKALEKALDGVADEIDGFVLANFPNYFSIAEVTEKDGNGKAKKLLISGGSSSGLSKGDKLKVVELKEIDVDGKKMTRKVAVCTLKVLNVEDENFSLCAVTSDDNDVAGRIAEKKKLKVTTVN